MGWAGAEGARAARARGGEGRGGGRKAPHGRPPRPKKAGGVPDQKTDTERGPSPPRILAHGCNSGQASHHGVRGSAGGLGGEEEEEGVRRAGGAPGGRSGPPGGPGALGVLHTAHNPRPGRYFSAREPRTRRAPAGAPGRIWARDLAVHLGRVAGRRASPVTGACGATRKIGHLRSRAEPLPQRVWRLCSGGPRAQDAPPGAPRPAGGRGATLAAPRGPRSARGGAAGRRGAPRGPGTPGARERPPPKMYGGHARFFFLIETKR